MMTTTQQFIAVLCVMAIMLTGHKAAACDLCVCLDNHPTQSCINGYCYIYRWTAYCNCYPGYKGTRCHLPVELETPDSPCEPNPCQSHGYCQEHQGNAICTCLTGYTGEFCESATDASPCDDAVCLPGQTCVALQLGYICV